MVAAGFLTSAIPVDKSLQIGNKAPGIETVNGINVVSDANSEGKEKVICFWSPKDAASRIAYRELTNRIESNIDQNLELVSICTDSDEALMREVIKIDGMKAENNYSFSEVSPRVFKDYYTSKGNKSYIIGTDGRISEIL